MIRSRLMLLFVVVALLPLVGCATIFKGGNEDVTFTSEPQGADVSVDGQPIGQTPVVAKLKSAKHHIIQMKADGYEPASMTLTNHVGAGWVVWDIFSWFGIALIVDALSGDWHYLDTDKIHFDLRPIR